jgi:hypothetical protein
MYCDDVLVNSTDTYLYTPVNHHGMNYACAYAYAYAWYTELWKFRFVTGQWQQLRNGTKTDFSNSIEPSPRAYSTAAWYTADERMIMVYGGEKAYQWYNAFLSEQVTDELWFYDIAVNQWSKGNTAPSVCAVNRTVCADGVMLDTLNGTSLLNISNDLQSKLSASYRPSNQSSTVQYISQLLNTAQQQIQRLNSSVSLSPSTRLNNDSLCTVTCDLYLRDTRSTIIYPPKFEGHSMVVFNDMLLIFGGESCFTNGIESGGSACFSSDIYFFHKNNMSWTRMTAPTANADGTYNSTQDQQQAALWVCNVTVIAIVVYHDQQSTHIHPSIHP